MIFPRPSLCSALGVVQANLALYGGARVDGSIFALPRFLVSSKPRLVSWFLQTSPVFLVSSKSCPFSWFLSLKPRPTMVVVTRRFSPDSVCSSTIDRCDLVLFFHHTLGRVSKRAQPHADAISSLYLYLSRSHIADFAFIIMALFNQFYSPCRHRSFFVCPGGGSVG